MSAIHGSLQVVADVLQRVDNIVICGHVSPDGDCIGSQLALAVALRQLGKHVTCLLAKDEPVEYGLRTLPGVADMVPASQFSGEIGAAVTVDVPTAQRMGDEAPLHASAPITITIDHHLFTVPLSQVYYVDSSAPACAMIIWELIGLMGIERTPDIATCCFTGLSTDTGSFRYQNANEHAFRLASEMVHAGADPSAIARDVYQSRSVESLRLEQVLLDNMEFAHNGTMVLSWLTQADFNRIGAVKADAEPLIDTLRSVRGVSVACILREQADCVRGSLRAKDTTDVAAIAARLGGGGHKAAAGFTFKGSLDAAQQAIREEFAKL